MVVNCRRTGNRNLLLAQNAKVLLRDILTKMFLANFRKENKRTKGNLNNQKTKNHAHYYLQNTVQARNRL